MSPLFFPRQHHTGQPQGSAELQSFIQGAAKSGGGHREPREAEKHAPFPMALHYPPVGAQDFGPTGGHCHPVERVFLLQGLGKDMRRWLPASSMLGRYTANAPASHMHFGTVLKQGSVNLIY